MKEGTFVAIRKPRDFGNEVAKYKNIDRTYFFIHLSFPSRTYTIHRTAGEQGGYFFNSSLPLLPASQALRDQPENCLGFCEEGGSGREELNRQSSPAS